MTTLSFTDGRAPCQKCSGTGRKDDNPCFACATLGYVVADVRPNPRARGMVALMRMYSVGEVATLDRRYSISR